MRGGTNFLNGINVICPVNPMLRKYSSSHYPQISGITRAVSSPARGRIRIVRHVGVRCGGRGSVERGRDRRADFGLVSGRPARQTNGADAYGKTVWFRHPLLVSSRRRFSRPTGFAQNHNPPATVTRRIRRRGEHGISRQTIVQGMPGCSDCTCMLVCVSCAHIARETAGAASTRRSLRPRLGGRFFNDPDASRRGIMDSYLDTVIASEAKQSIARHNG